MPKFLLLSFGVPRPVMFEFSGVFSIPTTWGHSFGEQLPQGGQQQKSCGCVKVKLLELSYAGLASSCLDLTAPGPRTYGNPCGFLDSRSFGPLLYVFFAVPGNSC